MTPGPERLFALLREKGAVPAGWEDAVRSVPREVFLPDVVETPGEEIIDRAREPERWLSAVYADLNLVTQVNDGQPVEPGAYRLPTSSSSLPSLMLEMLDLLGVEEGQRVLDIGAGTGYQTAWLAHRLGSARVVAVETDPSVAARAERNTRAAGFTPRIVCGDGADGWPDGAPYSRVIASYTVPAVPHAWVEQTPGGRVVAPWGGSFFHHSFVALDVAPDGSRAEGRFHGSPAFMRSRTGRPPRGFLRDFLHHGDEAVETRTALDPLTVARDRDALFFTDLLVPDAWHLEVEAGDGSGEVTWWLLADDRASWAAVDHVPGEATSVVAQYGPRALWDEVEAAHQHWQDLGRPPRDRFGLTVDADGQRAWLDAPDNPVGARAGARSCPSSATGR